MIRTCLFLSQAYTQHQYCVVYANLSKVMGGITVDWETEERRISFHHLLLSRVQKEFERHGNDEHVVSLQYAIGQASSVSEAW